MATRLKALIGADTRLATTHVGENTSAMRRLARHCGLIALALAMMYPLLWLLSSSFRPLEDIFTDPGLWPRTFTLENYGDGWTAFRDVNIG